MFERAADMRFSIAFTVRNEETEGDMAEDKSVQVEEVHGSNAEKDPDEWVAGDEPMTSAQKSYLKTLSDEAKEEFDETLIKGDASKRIEELQQKTGRGAS